MSQERAPSINSAPLSSFGDKESLKDQYQAKIQELQEINDSYIAWESRLNNKENEINELENQLTEKEMILATLSKNLDIVEERQKRFDQLLSIYEERSGIDSSIQNRPSRQEVLELTKSLSRKLENHQETLEKMNENTKTLKEMVYLMTDLHCKYSRLRKMALYNNLLNQPDEEEDFVVQEEEDEN